MQVRGDERGARRPAVRAAHEQGGGRAEHPPRESGVAGPHRGGPQARAGQHAMNALELIYTLYLFYTL